MLVPIVTLVPAVLLVQYLQHRMMIISILIVIIVITVVVVIAAVVLVVVVVVIVISFRHLTLWVRHPLYLLMGLDI